MSDARTMLSGVDPLMVLREEFGSRWDTLDPTLRGHVEATFLRAAELLALQSAGQDVSADLLHVSAQAKLWASGASAWVQRAMWAALLSYAEKAGEVLVAVAKTALLAAIG